MGSQNGHDVNLEDARFHRRQCLLMSVLSSVNHSALTTGLLYSPVMLPSGAVAQSGNAVFYAFTVFCSIFCAHSLYLKLGSKSGLALAMALETLYVTLFVVAASTASESLQLPLFVVGSSQGGFGLALMWTCQGAFLTLSSEHIANAESRPPAVVTGEFMGYYSGIHLFFETAFRLSTALVVKYGSCSFRLVFGVYAVISWLSTFALVCILCGIDDERGTEFHHACANVVQAIRLWRRPKLWMVLCTSITYGLSIAYYVGYVTDAIFLAVGGEADVGFFACAVVVVARMFALTFERCGERTSFSLVLMIGAVAFFLFGFLSTRPARLHLAVSLCMLNAGGKGAFESTNGRVLAQLFPHGEVSAALVNLIIFYGGSACIGFILDAAGLHALHRWLLFCFAAVSLPAHILARCTSRGTVSAPE